MPDPLAQESPLALRAIPPQGNVMAQQLDAVNAQLTPGGMTTHNRRLLDEAYRKLEGEVRARNVEARRGFSAAEGVKKPPWQTWDSPYELQIKRAVEDPAQPRLPGFEPKGD